MRTPPFVTAGEITPYPQSGSTRPSERPRPADTAGAPRASTAGESALLEAVRALASPSGVQQTCSTVLDVIERLFDAHSSWILLHESTTDELVTLEFRGPGADSYAAARIPAREGIVGKVFVERQSVFVADVEEEERWFEPSRVQRSGLKSAFTVPLEVEGEAVGVVGLDSQRFSPEAPPDDADIGRLRALGAIAAAAIRNARLLEEVEADRARLRRALDQGQHLRREVGHLRQRMRVSLDSIVGTSQLFREVLAQVDLVAPADATVLLVGETGTGKEIIAHAIHERSRRRARPFVPVNCAALPESLVESELFGHEKGAFTGALARKQGRFELAHLGTLFLDEVGDLPLQAQAKLLRVLQDREVHRVGALRGVSVDVRLIAATNCDLDVSMQQGTFRSDLFFRLSVFPIRLPPLRERREDIALLVRHYLQRFAEREHKPVPRLTTDAEDLLLQYHWPGNVRELQNVIERAVILVRGPVVGSELIAVRAAVQPDSSVSAETDRAAPASPPMGRLLRFDEAERNAILRALEACSWRISGRRGAADALGLKPTTLHAKMKKLGIHRPSTLEDTEQRTPAT